MFFLYTSLSQMFLDRFSCFFNIFKRYNSYHSKYIIYVKIGWKTCKLWSLKWYKVREIVSRHSNVMYSKTEVDRNILAFRQYESKNIRRNTRTFWLSTSIIYCFIYFFVRILIKIKLKWNAIHYYHYFSFSLWIFNPHIPSLIIKTH